MKILKYIFLLILLAFFALSVFVATQKGQFDITRTQVVASPRATVYNYVDDLGNWENFVSWKSDDPNMRFEYPKHTLGNGASMTFSGSHGNGSVKTLSTVENQKILQRLVHDGSESNGSWTFRDTVGGTAVTLHLKGKMGFGQKIYAAFNGGAAGIIGSATERSLLQLGKSLNTELTTFDVKVDGVVNKTGTYYLSKRIRSKTENVNKNIRILLPDMLRFFAKNKMTMYGKPFVILHNYNKDAKIVEMSVCIPVNREIFVSPGSDITPGKLSGFKAFKVTATGDYSHLDKAWEKLYAAASEKNVALQPGGNYVMLYQTQAQTEKHPSKWETVLYAPVLSRVVAPVVRPRPSVPAPVAAPASGTPENATP